MRGAYYYIWEIMQGKLFIVSEQIYIVVTKLSTIAVSDFSAKKSAHCNGMLFVAERIAVGTACSTPANK